MSVEGQARSSIPSFTAQNLCPQLPRFPPWFQREKALNLCADFVVKVGEEIAGAPAANAGAAHCCRSLQLERRLDALIPTPATQLQRYLTLTQHTRRQRAAVVLPALQGGAGSVR